MGANKHEVLTITILGVCNTTITAGIPTIARSGGVR